MNVIELEIGRIRPSEWNPRKSFPKGKIEKIADSLKASGLIQPVTVRPVGDAWELVAGECRLRAAKSLGWETITAVVREMDDVEVATVMMAENVSRSELNPVEEWAGVSRMVDLGMQADQVAERLGVAKRWVQGRLSLGELPETAKKAVAGEKLSLAAAEALLKVDREEREAAATDLLQFGDELTTAHAVDRLNERYFAPRERRRKWSKWCEGQADEGVSYLEDPETWGEYVLPYGKPLGKWRLEDEMIGAAAARAEDAQITFGDLAKAHGIGRLAVPVGGVVDEEFANVRVLVDGQAIAAAEKAAKKAGQPHTLGKRVVSDTIEEAEDQIGDEVDRVEELRGADWSPWVVARVLEEHGPDSAEVRAAEVACLVMDEWHEEWREDVEDHLEIAEGTLWDLIQEEFENWVPWAVWWLIGNMRDPEVINQLVERFGIRDVWSGKGGQS